MAFLCNLIMSFSSECNQLYCSELYTVFTQEINRCIDKGIFTPNLKKSVTPIYKKDNRLIMTVFPN